MKPAVKEAIIVEGKYDKITVDQVVDAVIIETSGFGIFSNNEKRELIRQIAEKRGIIILTDGDGAGFVIRNHLKGVIPPELIKNAYIPDIFGKEKRKREPSKEGKLGVEGMNQEVIFNALKRAGATFEDENSLDINREKLTKADLYDMGLSGRVNSSDRRKALLKKLDLPENLSPNGMLDVLNALYTREEILSLNY